MNSNVLEIRSFCLRPDVDERTLVLAADGSMPLMRRQRGFLARSIARGADGRWTEIVHWVDQASALAGERLRDHDETRPYYALIDAPTMESGYYPLTFSG